MSLAARTGTGLRPCSAACTPALLAPPSSSALLPLRSPCCASTTAVPRTAAGPRLAARRLAPSAAAAEKGQQLEARWESQVRTGKVRNISAQDVRPMQAEGWTVLDVRPGGEVAKAAVSGGVHVPLFVEDPSNDLGSFIKKATDFGMGGWWLGGTHNVPNEKFGDEVQAKLPRDTKLIVVCQKGLRSLAACETLARLGYSDLAWVNGGLDSAQNGEIDTVNGVDIRYGGVGGLSGVLGWTEVQRAEKKEFAGGITGVISFFLLILAADVALFAYEQLTYMQKTGAL